jgi:hypothetical protein
MGFRFALCSDCQTRYQVLQFDPAAGYSLNIMPLCSLIWPDEHPDGEVVTDYDASHEECRGSVMRLAWARTQLWRTGSVPEESRELWEDARRVLPDWPGLWRLVLSPGQVASLDGCAEEVADFMGAVQQDFPEVSTTDEGGGLRHFIARRAPEGGAPEKK